MKTLKVFCLVSLVVLSLIFLGFINLRNPEVAQFEGIVKTVMQEQRLSCEKEVFAMYPELAQIKQQIKQLSYINYRQQVKLRNPMSITKEYNRSEYDYQRAKAKDLRSIVKQRLLNWIRSNNWTRNIPELP